MAAQTPAMFQNENLHIPRGKAIDGGKTALLKPEKKERKDRKALADLSKPAKPVLSATIKGSTIKDNSLRGVEKTKKAPKSSILTDEDIKRCHEWAKEGNEKVHYTGNDIQKNEKEVMEKRIKKKVDMVMSSLSKWNQDFMTIKLQRTLDMLKSLELEPEVPFLCDDEALRNFLGEPEIIWPLFDDQSFEFTLKEANEGGDPAPFQTTAIRKAA
ncbi:unnamed protein product [Spirodela intermedia]|uniref:Uncharacterized protein n=1 Tax=Spirodela intermedia TaxID=51605 RepID=A0A7I8IIY4_SPIIN|nr:unnamed protein product [Spirodela intermedia]CAA6657687.1 unnamed protein product [Spirodela intermedia]